MDKIKVFVADDSLVARNMLIRLLSKANDIEIAGEAGTAQSSIMLMKELSPDIILLEASIGGGMGISDLVKQFKSCKPDAKVILTVDASGIDAIADASGCGAFDFAQKPYNKANILRLIREAAQ
ncbi:MAG: response regulator [Clostridiales bacterium]|jgi:DNA-binding NarL/FixJ family response regulator|nr:response regulator [Clostridiales bacterium]